MALSTHLLYFGVDQPPPEQIPLRAGPLAMLYENGDLRYVTYGGREIVRRIYAAARDRVWGTAPNVLRDVVMDIGADAFAISYTCHNVLHDIDFTWRGSITGSADGALSFTFDGVAGSTFQRARLGFCVLHPPQLAGQSVQVERVDGARIDTRFPRRIAPQQVVDGVIKPVPELEEMRALSHAVAPGVTMRLAFEGDIFELEDQRNWTDGSFKTYCTPLRLPWPVEVPQGTRVRQRITLSLSGNASAPVRRPARKAAPVTLQPIKTETPSALPKLGYGSRITGDALKRAETALLRVLKPAHLRVDLALDGPDWPRRLKTAAVDARALGAALELGVFVRDAADSELTAFQRVYNKLTVPVARMLIFHRNTAATPAGLIPLARQHLGASAKIYAGSNKFFTEVNCNRPSRALLGQLSGLCYGLNPQVHAFDNTSLIETPAMQAETLHSARAFAGKLPLAVTPVTLKPRFGLADPGPEPVEAAGQADPRQWALFGAAWTVASLANLAQADSLTLYETASPRGVIDTGGALAFPLYHVLADVAEFGGAIVPLRSSAPLSVQALLQRKGRSGRQQWLIANLSATPQTARLNGLPKRVGLRMLDEHTVERAVRAPLDYRAETPQRFATQTGVLEVQLLPYAVARIN